MSTKMPLLVMYYAQRKNVIMFDATKACIMIKMMVSNI